MTEFDERRAAAGGPGAAGAAPRRLEEILRALPESELSGLIRRLGIRTDPQKRIDVPSQVARVLVAQADIREPGRLPPATQELLRRLVEAGGLLRVEVLPPGFEPLMARGILFVRREGESFVLVVPDAYVVQMPTWQGEDPRCLRALLAQAPFETATAIAAHYLGRPATPPIALALETAWEALREPSRLREEIERLPPLERRLLEAIEEQGGEVETAELLDLEREPMRLRSAKGVSTTRRGAGFALERRALLVPIHPNRHVVPTEAAAIVGEARSRLVHARRAAVRREVLGDDLMPRRARFARDPAVLALALAIAAREAGSEVRQNVGTPRSLVQRLAQRYGRSPESVGLLSALGRAVGLWDVSALSVAAPPGSLSVGELGPQLFSTWLGGGAWDEARMEQEALRAGPDQRESSPIRALRTLVLESLLDLGEEGWVPYVAFERYVLDDARVAGFERLVRRWSERLGLGEPMPVADMVARIVLESLPVLGVVDLGDDSHFAMPSVGAAAGADDARVRARQTALRLTPRGRTYLARADVRKPVEPAAAFGANRAAVRLGADVDVEVARGPGASERAASRFVESHVLRVGGETLVGHVLALATLAEVGRVDDALELVLSPTVIARAISGGALSDEVRQRIEAVAPLPDTISQTLQQVSAVVGRATFVQASAFLWVEDVDVRELLRTRRGTAELFVDPSPPGGLLVAAQVDLERLVRRCRGVGVEVELPDVAEGTFRASRMQTPRVSPNAEPPSRSGTRALPVRASSPPPRSRTPLPRTR